MTIIGIIVFAILVSAGRYLSILSQAGMSRENRIKLRDSSSTAGKYSIASFLVVSVVFLFLLKDHGMNPFKAVALYSVLSVICSAVYYYVISRNISGIREIVASPTIFTISKTLMFISLCYLIGVLYLCLNTRVEIMNFVAR